MQTAAAHSILKTLLTIPASCTRPAAKQMQGASTIMHHGLASSNSTPQCPHDAQAQPHAAASVQQAPHSSPRHLLSTQAPRQKQTLQIQPVNGLARSETAQDPLPEYMHASIAKPLTQPAPASRSEASSKWRRTLIFSLVDAVHADRMFLVLCDFPPRPAACGARSDRFRSCAC